MKMKISTNLFAESALDQRSFLHHVTGDVNFDVIFRSEDLLTLDALEGLVVRLRHVVSQLSVGFELFGAHRATVFKT